MADDKVGNVTGGNNTGMFLSLTQPDRFPSNLPSAPGVNPFADLPHPVPGDRIKAAGFQKFSRALEVIRDSSRLSGALFGESYGHARLVLNSLGYDVRKVMTVSGDNLSANDSSLDSREVLQVMPVELGERGVVVVVATAMETRRFTPNLLGLSYREGSERLRALVGDLPVAGPPVNAMELEGFTLGEAIDILKK